MAAARRVAPTALADPTLVAFDADRPDFNGALAQFAIGLLQTTAPVETNTAWRELFRSPPSVETLAQWFAPGDKQSSCSTGMDRASCRIARLHRMRVR